MGSEYLGDRDIQFSEEWVCGLFGAGGFGREVMPFALENVAAYTGGKITGHICFVVSNPTTSVVNGIPCLSESDFFALKCERKSFNVSIADSASRQTIADRWIANQVEPMTLRSRSAEDLGHNNIGDGAILCGFSSVMPNTKIGKFFHANYYSYVAHDCVIGDYVTFAPNVRCSGNIRIGDHAYIGAGAIIKQGSADKPLIIGAGAVIGMGAVVTKDVLPHTTVVGNPAHPL